ncbi:MAG: hypothetical protein ACFFAO_09455, partial [Candidatus Hermodarchaeota archaeon]
MSISKFKLGLIAIIIIIIAGYTIALTPVIYSEITSKKEENSILKTKDSSKINENSFNTVKSSDEILLPNKVYTFLAPNYEVTFDLYLEGEYMYYIYIELVTPHNCSLMRITLWDSESRKFDIFENEMFYEPEYGRYFEIPFGTTDSGDYNVSFYME